MIEKNNYEIHQSFLGNLKPKYQGEFYKVGNIINRPVRLMGSKYLLTTRVYLTNKEKKFNRKSYTF